MKMLKTLFGLSELQYYILTEILVDKSVNCNELY